MSERKPLDLVPAQIRPAAEHARRWIKALSKPARVLLAATTVAITLMVAWVAIRSSSPTYVVLFSNLEREDAASIVAKLKEMKVPYQLEADGTVVEVPEAQVREVRLELAGAGLPRGGAVGFESFDKLRLGATEFEQRVLYRRALEGELARTIGTLTSVQNARVHLVLPEKSVFVARSEPASASVVIKLRAGRSLGGGEVAGIVHLVASSVPGLAPERVSIVGTDGAVLHKPKRAGEEPAGADDQASLARTIEGTLEERARALVEKVVGAGHVDVRVTADVDSSRIERTEDHYDPKTATLRSEERSVERHGDEGAPTVAGVPGAESNLPTGAARGVLPVDGGAAAGPTRESHTRNFEVDHVTEKRLVSGGVLRRLTVAVAVDGSKSGSKEELDKIASLVRSAVGFDERRGDVVTVEAVPFTRAAADETPPAPTPGLFAKRKVQAALAGAGALVVVVAIVLAVRMRRRRAKATAAPRVEPPSLPEPTEGDRDGLRRTTGDELRRAVSERAAADPATAALVLRGWLGQHDEVREAA